MPVSTTGLQHLLARIWSALEAAPSTSDSPFRCLTLATLNEHRRPSQRTLVLRDVDPDARRLVFFTDRRSAKATQITAHSGVSLHAYDAGRQIQLRMEGEGDILTGKQARDWLRTPVPRQAWSLYGAQPPPGSPVKGPNDVHPADSQETLESAFSVLTVTVDTMEWLELTDPPHHRAFFRWPDAHDKEPVSQWLAP